MAVDEPQTDERRENSGWASYRMKIGGMSCSFCSSTIRKAYERMDGVSEVGVSLAHEEGLVRYDPGKVMPAELRRTLEQVGFTYRDPAASSIDRATGWTLIPLLLGDGPNFFRATFAALAVLVLGYPCALGMSTPLAMIRGGGEAAENGILMRSGEAFQIMGELRSIALDKTGTITRGAPKVQQVVALGEHDEDQVLARAASAASASEHPLARAIEDAAEERGVEVILSDDFQSHTATTTSET